MKTIRLSSRWSNPNSLDNVQWELYDMDQILYCPNLLKCLYFMVNHDVKRISSFEPKQCHILCNVISWSNTRSWEGSSLMDIFKENDYFTIGKGRVHQVKFLVSELKRICYHSLESVNSKCRWKIFWLWFMQTMIIDVTMSWPWRGPCEDQVGGTSNEVSYALHLTSRCQDALKGNDSWIYLRRHLVCWQSIRNILWT